MPKFNMGTCPSCNNRLDAFKYLDDGELNPTDGSVIICFYCCSLLILEKCDNSYSDFQLILCTQEQVEEAIKNSPELLDVLQALRETKNYKISVSKTIN